MPDWIAPAPPADGVARLTLARPERKNALSIALRDEVTAALAALAADETVRAVVVTGAGDAFSAGFDLGEFRRLGGPDFARRPWDSADRFHRALPEFPLPLVAAEEALALRLVFAVVPPDALLAAAGRVAAQIARAPRALLARTKAKAARRARIDFETTLDL